MGAVSAVEEVVLELFEDVLSRLSRPIDFLHLLPNVLDREVDEVLSGPSLAVIAHLLCTLWPNSRFYHASLSNVNIHWPNTLECLRHWHGRGRELRCLEQYLLGIDIDLNVITCHFLQVMFQEARG